MSRSAVFVKILPPILAGVFLCVALVTFITIYSNLDSAGLPSFGRSLTENTIIFYLNFYVQFFMVISFLAASLFCSKEKLKIILSVFSFIFSILSCYVLDDLFTIKFGIYAATVIINAAIFPLRKSFLLNGIFIFLYVVFLFHPSFLGTGSGVFTFEDKPQFSHIMMLVCLLLGFASMVAYIRFLYNENNQSEDTVKHLHLIITQLTAFNHRLQEYAKNSGEEAIKTDRLRFTSDLHDKCGYVFTIIITLTEAAISFGEPIPQKVETTLQKIRKQAREGLQQTRDILNMIRNIQEPWAGSIDTIYQMKLIFEDVTGIKVDIEIGNIRYSYGQTINKVLERILQEAFTNSIRHGKASYILIQFWEYPDELTMTVTDNGTGAKMVVKSIGLAGMEERLAEIGGNLDVSSPVDGGFKIRVRIPIANIRGNGNISGRELINGGSESAYSPG